MLEVAYKINHTDEMVIDVAKALGQKLKSPRFETVNGKINSSVEFYRLNESLSIQLSKFHPKESIKVNRLGTDNENLLILDFHLSGIAKLNVTDERIDDTANGLTHGAYFANTSVQSYAVFQPEFYNQQFHVVLDKQWMSSFFSDEVKFIIEKIEKATPFFMYERLNSSITVLLISIFKSNFNSNFRKSFLHGKTLQLLSMFFEKLQKRGEHLKIGVSNYDDVSRLFELMIYVDEHLGEDLTVASLSQRIGCSESKLQTLCKAVYGKSMSKEITERRMLKALELFEASGDSISVVGYKLGYTNMSHFANTFKKIHGFLPSQYLHKKAK